MSRTTLANPTILDKRIQIQAQTLKNLTFQVIKDVSPFMVQRDIRERTGLSITEISKIVNDREMPTFSMSRMFKILNGLGYDVDITVQLNRRKGGGVVTVSIDGKDDATAR